MGEKKRKGVPRDDRRVSGQRHSGQYWLIIPPDYLSVARPGRASIAEGAGMDVLELRDAAYEDADGRVPFDVNYEQGPRARGLVLIEGGEDATPVIPLRPRRGAEPELPEAA